MYYQFLVNGKINFETFACSMEQAVENLKKSYTEYCKFLFIYKY